MNSENLLILVDGSSYLFRAYHGLPKLTSRAGEPTGAIKGVISMIQKLHEDNKSSHIAIVFDAPGKTFRHEMYHEYKSHRPPIDDDLRIQIKPLLQLIKSMGYPLIQISGVEADDVIGTLAKTAVEENMQVLISTGDKDLAQLVDGNTRLIDTMKMQITDHSNVADKFKVEALRAEQVIDFLALVGDTADNIPGIPKVGPKTAAKWLAEYNDIETIIEHKEDIKGKVGEYLRDNLEQLHLSRELTTIKLDVDLPDVEINQLSMNAIDNDTFTTLCQRFDLTKLHSQVLGVSATNEAVQTQINKPEIVIDYQFIDNQAKFSALLTTLAESSSFCFEALANNESYTQAELVGLSFATCAGKAYYLPLAHEDDNPQLNIVETLLPLKSLFANKQEKITFDGKYAIHLLNRYGIVINNLHDDIMLASYVYHSTANKHLLENITEKHLQYKMLESESLLGKGVKKQSVQQLTIEACFPYASERVDMIARLADHLLLRVNSIPGLQRVYREIEMPFIHALQLAENRGILIDSDKLKQQSQRIAITIDELETRAYELAEGKFNLNSPKQLQEILFDKLQLPIIKKTPKGQPSTNEEVLQTLAIDHELPRIIIENRGLSKLKSTYTDKLPETVQPATERVHTTYHQAITSTGRLSSSDPNLQNIPIRTAEGRKIRQAFIAPAGYSIMASDYSQIELRIMAHLSKDQGLVQAFKDNKDIHSQTAAEIFEILESEVTSDYRRKAKAINFGLIYGMSAFGLAKQIDVSRSEAGQYIEAYFEKYPSVKQYMSDISGFAKELGYVETIFGRRLHIPDITSTNAIRRNAAERLSINAPMQGSAADIIKIAMNEVTKKINNNPDIRLIMQVHDELVFEVKTEILEQAKTLITKTMQDAVTLSVPLVVETGFGSNWDEAH